MLNNPLLAATFILLLLTASAQAASPPPTVRYVHHGDGQLTLSTNKSKATFDGRFRNPDGTYDEAALGRIHAVFGAKFTPKDPVISHRLIEFLDFIQDRFGPKKRVTIASGYRSPTYNTNLRNRGKLAAKASLHQYGMAADIVMKGVPSKRIWEFVQEIGFGGAGYYGGSLVHVDVGPARSWTAATSGVGTGISDDNKLIRFVTDRDIYLPGEGIQMRFIRMTAFPIGVDATFILERQHKEGEWKEVKAFDPTFAIGTNGAKCPQFGNIDEMRSIRWIIPSKLKGGTYRVRATFCDSPWPEMPEAIETPPFEVQS